MIFQAKTQAKIYSIELCPRDARAFIEMAGYPCPPNYNPADHILYTLAIVPGEEDRCREKIKRICDDYDSSDLGEKSEIN